MDWENKFYSIVKETEDNLAKAKEKLSGKASTPTGSSEPGQAYSSHYKIESCFSPQSANISTPFYKPQHFHYSSAPLPETPLINMSTASGIQVMHMQEQIDSQYQTIERLQKLVRSLDSERDFYKEQISHLKGEVESLTDRMTSQLAKANTERQIASVKREVMKEIEKVKTMLQNSSRDASKRSSLSPRLDTEFWAVKENLTENLEQVRYELSLMNKRIDRMESQIASQPTERLDSDRSSRSHHVTLPRQPLYTPTYKGPEYVKSLDLQELRMSINSLNSKLDGLEKKVEGPHTQSSTLYSPLLSARPTYMRRNLLLYDDDAVDNDVDVDDLSSLSDLSDLSNLGDDVDIDEEIDALTYRLKDGSKSPRQSEIKSSIYKKDRVKKGKVEFDLSDLELSDVDDVDIDTDSLDLDK